METRTPRRFYMVVLQYMLLFGLELWVVIPNIMWEMGSFHNCAALIISGQIPQCQNGRREYPLISEELEEAGMEPIAYYISCLHTSVA